RKSWCHLLQNPTPRFHRILPPDRRTRRKNFNKRKAQAIPLDLERLTNGAPSFHDVLIIRERYPFDVCRSFQRGQQFRHVDREALIRRPPPPRRSCALLPDQGRRRRSEE